MEKSLQDNPKDRVTSLMVALGEDILIKPEGICQAGRKDVQIQEIILSGSEAGSYSKSELQEGVWTDISCIGSTIDLKSVEVDPLLLEALDQVIIVKQELICNAQQEDCHDLKLCLPDPAAGTSGSPVLQEETRADVSSTSEAFQEEDGESDTSLLDALNQVVSMDEEIICEIEEEDCHNIYRMAKRARHVKQVRTLHERLKIIEEVENSPGEKRIDVAKRLRLAPSTLNSIISKKKIIREQVDKCGKSCMQRKTARQSTFSELETVLFAWYQQARAANIPVDGTSIMEKAKQIAALIGIENFTGSNGWMTRFKHRHGLIYKKLSGENAAADRDTTALWLERLPKLLEEYGQRDIYNADETGLFYNCLPDRTLTLMGDSCPGGKRSKERMTILLCTNSDGSDKMQPIVIGKYINPRCFKNLKTLPVKYYANNKAWMTTKVFMDFLRALDATMGAQHRKILLFVDHCPAHPQNTTFLKNVRVVFYPTKCSGVVQPLDKGVIQCFKQLYRKMFIKKALCMKDSGSDVGEATLNILQAIHYTVAAWRQVTQLTIINSFLKCGYGSEPERDSDAETIVVSESEEEDDTFRDDWTRLDLRNNVDFDTYANCDGRLATCGVESIRALCDALEEGTGEEKDAEREAEPEAEAEPEPEPIPTFAEAHAAFEKVKTFFYAHSIVDRDKVSICNMERSPS